ncbi:hypothetical protein B566_EDAN005424 [Ephemera danica]|nr:hypothetical protein B566_EDAN005424 [Ephemera danica]
MTDAKSADNMGSRQYVAEWEYYKDVLEECKVVEKTLWLDVKGNHDTFNVPGQESSQNFFRNYSIQGAKHIRSYMVQVPRKDEIYSFIAVDASLEPGPRRPFNFIGVLGIQEFEQLKKFEQQARENGNFTIWFGHYPSSCILTPDPGLRDIIGRSGLAYLCGHLHKVGGLVPNMYVMQKAGHLELELADWKDNRMYRLGAIDHGLFNFIDIPHGEWPVILVTNPKHALYIMPDREPMYRIHNSTHIRVLVFSPAPIIRVMIRIDQAEWQTCNQVSGPLYVVPWNATLYTSDSHTIEVVAEDAERRIKSLSQPFSLDGTRPSFNIFPRITLMTNASAIVSSVVLNFKASIKYSH